jgi:two-component system sensor histidine kinase DegS
MSETTTTEESPLQLLIKDSFREYEQVQVELKEIDVLIQQSTGEVEKLARRHAQATNTLRHIQANIESMPREDIQEAYSTVQDAQQRLFTMRGQLEKLQSDQKNMERYAALLRRIAEVGGLGGPAGAGAGAPGLSEDQPIIVRVVEALETERRRLSRAMHDGPAQSMTNFILQTEICQRLFNSDRQRAEQELIGLKGAATDTFQRIRDFVFELRPMMLDDLGLVPTLRRYAEMFKNKYNIPVEVTIIGKDRRLNPHVEVAIFRIVQELLNNIRDHAQATQARITVEIEDDGVRAIVDDNGAGFSVDDALAEARQKGTVGLSTMFERVEMLGGSLDIDSKPGQGTHVVVSIPSVEEQTLV